MTNDELQAHLAAIKEALQNGEIEERHPDVSQFGWMQAACILVGTDTPYEHRIKSKPLECWVNVHEYSGALSAVVYDSEQEAIEGGDFKLPPVHMREVTE